MQTICAVLKSVREQQMTSPQPPCAIQGLGRGGGGDTVDPRNTHTISEHRLPPAAV